MQDSEELGSDDASLHATSDEDDASGSDGDAAAKQSSSAERGKRRHLIAPIGPRRGMERGGGSARGKRGMRRAPNLDSVHMAGEDDSSESPPLVRAACARSLIYDIFLCFEKVSVAPKRTT